uniref:Uncharacterized protein n=1 Tax=Triticum urartu TaxID=4572 RepID=A0A8R7QMW3_TRIUA
MFSRFRGHVSWEMGCHALDLCTWTEAIKGSSHERGVRGLRAPVEALIWCMCKWCIQTMGKVHIYWDQESINLSPMVAGHAFYLQFSN